MIWNLYNKNITFNFYDAVSIIFCSFPTFEAEPWVMEINKQMIQCNHTNQQTFNFDKS